MRRRSVEARSDCDANHILCGGISQYPISAVVLKLALEASTELSISRASVSLSLDG